MCACNTSLPHWATYAYIYNKIHLRTHFCATAVQNGPHGHRTPCTTQIFATITVTITSILIFIYNVYRSRTILYIIRNSGCTRQLAASDINNAKRRLMAHPISCITTDDCIYCTDPNKNLCVT